MTKEWLLTSSIGGTTSSSYPRNCKWSDMKTSALLGFLILDRSKDVFTPVSKRLVKLMFGMRFYIWAYYIINKPNFLNLQSILYFINEHGFDHSSLGQTLVSGYQTFKVTQKKQCNQVSPYHLVGSHHPQSLCRDRTLPFSWPHL